MPYIKQERRQDLNWAINQEEHLQPSTEGELNYVLTVICQTYLRRKGINYSNINTVIGVLECTKAEFYRRIASMYEERKIVENGDVMELA